MKAKCNNHGFMVGDWIQLNNHDRCIVAKGTDKDTITFRRIRWYDYPIHWLKQAINWFKR